MYDGYVSSFWVAGGFKTTQKDKDNLPVFGISDAFYTLLQKLFDNWSQDGMCHDPYYNAGGGVVGAGEENVRYFEGGHALFYAAYVDTCQSLRDMEDDFGLVPYPKYTEDQTEYLSSTADGYINVVPSTAPDLERTSVILEALAVETKNIVMLAYIDKSLESKALRDDESIAFLNIVLDNRTLDLGATVWMTTVRFALVDNCFAKGSSDFASSIAKKQSIIDKTISEAVANFFTEG